MITLEMFTECFYGLGFYVTPDRDADKEHKLLPRQGNKRIEARFKKTTLWSSDMHFYAEIEIDNSMDVTVKWIALKFIKFKLNM